MNSPELHQIKEGLLFAEVILPLAVPRNYTYWVPEELVPVIQPGMRVEVQFGKIRRYSAIVADLNTGHQNPRQVKPILAVIDATPIVDANQLKLWKWMSAYYSCSQGEIMTAALPAGFRLASETKICISPLFDGQYEDLNDDEFLIVEALSIQSELSVQEVCKILNKKKVYPIINHLLNNKMIYLKEEIKQKYQPKRARCLRLSEPYRSEPESIKTAFDLLSKSNRQLESMMALLDLLRKKKGQEVQVSEIYQRAKSDLSVLRAIEKKGIIEIYEVEISRLVNFETEENTDFVLSEMQQNALDQIKTEFATKKVNLLRGVTGSGKTEIYIRLIQQFLKEGKQVLYLLPEIALTAQITDRLSKIFGEQLTVYHSRLNHGERVELWHRISNEGQLILGVRSSVFLPFKNLGLIIVDEEHDSSYKQSDPAPRYNGRDLAIYLGGIHGAQLLLGSATPALESYYNAVQGKYGLITLTERYGPVQLPKIEIIDLDRERKKKRMHTHFSATLLEALEAELAAGRQAILFKNRRGFSPSLSCKLCSWSKQCPNCDVSLTYHKYNESLRCHYCGNREELPQVCPSCGNHELEVKGYGTEKIEEELKVLMPDAQIGRMDLETVKGKDGIQKILYQFGAGKIDILVGTQMVTKGLDFENVGMVGVMSADQMLYYPDFRSAERAFQLMTQVSGRAGRRAHEGKVFIQTYRPDHPVIHEVVKHDYIGFFQRELQERRTFNYPPFNRLIQITLKHKDAKILNEAAKIFIHPLRTSLGHRVKGPVMPGVGRIRGLYLLNILLKLEKENQLLASTKRAIWNARAGLIGQKGFSSVRVIIDVDPM